MGCVYSVFIRDLQYPKPILDGPVFGLRPLNGVMFAHEFWLMNCDFLATTQNKN